MDEARTVWVVQADVPTETYRTLEICADEQEAQQEASRIVRRLIQAAGQRQSWHDDNWHGDNWHGDNWQDGLQRLRSEHVRRGGDADDYAVWIEPKNVRGWSGTGAEKVAYDTILSD